MGTLSEKENLIFRRSMRQPSTGPALRARAGRHGATGPLGQASSATSPTASGAFSRTSSGIMPGVVRRAYATVHAVLYFWYGFLPIQQVSMNSCHLVLVRETLEIQYFSAVFDLWNVSAFSTQLYWRASPRREKRMKGGENEGRKRRNTYIFTYSNNATHRNIC